MNFLIFKNNLLQKFSIVILMLSFLCGSVGLLQAQENEQELFLVAQKAFEDGFYDVAMRYINQLLEQYPQTEKRVETNLLLGQCYFFKSQYLKAYDIFQDTLQYAKLKDATIFWLGETYLKGADYKQAEQHYRQVIDVYPHSEYAPQAYYSLGWVFFERNEFVEAKELFLKLIKNFPIHQLTEDALFKLGESEYNLQSYETTIQYFTNYVMRYPQSRRHAQCYFYIAEAYYYLQDVLTAVTYYAKAAEMAYDNNLILMARVSLGWSYLKLGKLNLAQGHFDSAYQFSTEKGILTDDVLLGQASLYVEMGQHKKAIASYGELIEQFVNSSRIAEAYLGYANTYYLLGKYAAAIKSYKILIEKLSEDKGRPEIMEKAYFGLAWAYLKAGNIDSSIKTFETIKDKTQSKTVKISALTQIGDAYQDVGQFENAIEIYDKILREYPESIYVDYVQYRQGIALLKMERIDAATLSFQSLQTNFPESQYLADVKYYLAVAYFTKEDWATAKKQIVDFINGGSGGSELLAEANYILALSYFNLEEYNEAQKIFQKIIRNYPSQSAMLKKAEVSIAKCIYKLGDVKTALKRFKIFIYKYPQSEATQEALMWLGEHYEESEELSQSLGYYEKFIADFPGSEKLGTVYYKLGQVYEAQQEYDQAIKAFKKINAEKDSSLFAQAQLAIASIFTKELDHEKALKTYQDIILTSPEFKRDAYVKIAEVWMAAKDYAKTIVAYQNALHSDKGESKFIKAQLQFNIADMYERLNQRKASVDEYLKIPYLYPEDVPWVVRAYLRVGRIFEDDEQWEDAKIIYNKIVQFQTDELKFAQERLEWIEKNTVE